MQQALCQDDGSISCLLCADRRDGKRSGGAFSHPSNGSGRLRQSSGMKAGASIRHRSRSARSFASSMSLEPMKTISCRRSPQTWSR